MSDLFFLYFLFYLHSHLRCADPHEAPAADWQLQASLHTQI